MSERITEAELREMQFRFEEFEHPTSDGIHLVAEVRRLRGIIVQAAEWGAGVDDMECCECHECIGPGSHAGQAELHRSDCPVPTFHAEAEAIRKEQVGDAL